MTTFYEFWNPKWTSQLKVGPLAFDFETEVVDLTTRVPRPVVMSVSDGENNVLVYPDQLGEFVETYHRRTWVGFHVSFDWHVMNQHLDPFGPTDLWEKLVNEGRLKDAMLLDQLVRLAQGVEGKFFGDSLASVAWRLCQIKLDEDKKEERLQFGQYLGQPLSVIPVKRLRYSAGDAYATWHVYHKLEKVAVPKWEPKSGWSFGVLSEDIQVKASLVLAELTRTGFAVDGNRASTAAVEWKLKADQALNGLLQYRPSLIKQYSPRSKRAGQVQLTDSGLPKINMVKSGLLLTEAATESGVELPESPKAHVAQIGVPTLRALADGKLKDHPVVQLWSDYQESVKLYQFAHSYAHHSRVHPHYNTLVKTGRTSSWGPNLQNVPRESWFRSLFIADPGATLIVADYSAIELVTLAAVLERRYGRSQLAEVIRSGKDPHSWTASIFLGVPYEEFVAKVRAKDPEAKQNRQATKAVNFGVPGGLGAKKLKWYALNNYGVKLTLEECRSFRTRLITEVYPELQKWLDDNLITRLSNTIGVEEGEVEKVFGPDGRKTWRPEQSPVARYLSGEPSKYDGNDWSPYFEEETWLALEHLVEQSDDQRLVEMILNRERGHELVDRLMVQSVVTLTGRVRGRVNYGEARNTQFQGLAADGAKLALWDLRRDGHRLITFVHDEIVVAVPSENPAVIQQEGERVAQTMKSAMRAVLTVDLPVSVEWSSGKVWSK